MPVEDSMHSPEQVTIQAKLSGSITAVLVQ